MIPDFVIPYDPKKDDGYTIFSKIIYAQIVKQYKMGKSPIVFVSGMSGSGKSYSSILLQYILSNEFFKWDYKEHMDDVNIYLPKEYGPKMNALLTNKDLKKVNTIAIHEARILINAKEWMSFVNTTVAHVNAMSRAVKRLIMIIVSQSLSDITKDVRKTINHYWQITRSYEKPAHLRWYVIYHDERDIENIRVKKRKLRGYLVHPDGTYQKYSPSYFALPRIPKELGDHFDKADSEAKLKEIEKRLDAMLDSMTDKDTEAKEKLTRIVSWYTKSPDKIAEIGHVYRNKWKLKKESMELLSLNKEEAKIVERMIGDNVQKGDMVKNEESGL